MSNTPINTTTKRPVFRQSMSALHTWAGLLPSWILYFMFITGTAGYFNTEITQWMQPETPFSGEPTTQAKMLGFAEQRLKIVGAKADEWHIDFPDDRNGFLHIKWKNNLSENEKTKLIEKGFTKEQIEISQETEELLYPKTGLPVEYADGATQPRETGGGYALYQMHYELHYLPEPVAKYLVIFCTLFMLVALVTGIVVHKRIFKDFFTFRPDKKQRSWLDAHNMFSVLSLPFQLMITYSGLLYALRSVMPVLFFAPIALMGFDVANMREANGIEEMSPKNQKIIQVVQEEIFNQPKVQKPSGTAAALTPLTPMLTHVQARRPDTPVQYIKVENAHDANAQVLLHLVSSVGPDNDNHYVFNGVSGEILRRPDNSNESFLRNVREVDTVMRNLHEGLFAPIILRWLYVLSGLMGAGMIATGSILWVVKRRENAEKKGRNSKGLVLVESLNAGTIVGLPIAVAVYFVANRLIPAELEMRADWELHALFLTWGLMFTHAVIRPQHRVWGEQLWLAAAAYALLPVLNAFTSERHLGTSLVQGDWVMAGFDLTMLLLGVSFALVARRGHKKRIPIEAPQNQSLYMESAAGRANQESPL